MLEQIKKISLSSTNELQVCDYEGVRTSSKRLLWYCRAAKEGKERRRQWAQKRTVAKSEKKRDEAISNSETGDDLLEQEPEEKRVVPGMLPKDIVDILAAREK